MAGTFFTFHTSDLILLSVKHIKSHPFGLNNGSGSLPLNSLATDIFIDDEDCLVNLNPSITNYSVIENTSGLAKGIPVGDYELNQPEDGSVTKQGIMETPELDSNNDRQAF